jgi:hypothetical protein
MALQTTAIKNALCTAYAAAITHIGLATTAPACIARHRGVRRLPGLRPQASQLGHRLGRRDRRLPAAHDVPAGTTVVGINMENALTAGTYQDGATVTSQTFASQGTYTVVATFTES